jgi:hypothetical protein
MHDFMNSHWARARGAGMLNHDIEADEDACETPPSPARWEMTPDGLRYYPADSEVPVVVTDTPLSTRPCSSIRTPTSDGWSSVMRTRTGG